MPTQPNLDRLDKSLADALLKSLRSSPLLPGTGALQEPVVLGKGGNGLVLRGYVLAPSTRGAATSAGS